MNIGILTSGGDAPGMNAFVSRFTNLAKNHNYKIFAIKFGFQGLIENQVVELNKKDVDNIVHLGGSFIKSFRSSEFQTEKGFSSALKNYKKNKLDCLIVLGGDGSLKGCQALMKSGVKLIFIPATIDNDMYYSEKALGFDSAVSSAVEQIDKIKQTMLSLNRIFICEVMGRRCPDIANYCSLAVNADVTIADKKDADIENIYTQISSALKNGSEAPSIILRENILNANTLAKQIQNKFDIETRYDILGYTQRGASPSVFDRIFAQQLADETLGLITKSIFSKALGLKNNDLETFDIDFADSVTKR